MRLHTDNYDNNKLKARVKIYVLLRVSLLVMFAQVEAVNKSV